MSITRVSEKGQIVIPSPLRKKYGIKPKSAVLVIDLNGKIVVVPLMKDPVKEARGILKGGRSLARALLEERRKEVEREEIRTR